MIHPEKLHAAADPIVVTEFGWNGLGFLHGLALLSMIWADCGSAGILSSWTTLVCLEGLGSQTFSGPL